MKSSKSVAGLLRGAAKRDEFHAEKTILHFTEELVAMMEKRQVSRSGLAEKLRFTPAYVTKVLRGGENLTVLTMTKLARGVGAELRLHLAPAGTQTYWSDSAVTDKVDEVVAVPTSRPLTGRVSMWADEGNG